MSSGQLLNQIGGISSAGDCMVGGPLFNMLQVNLQPAAVGVLIPAAQLFHAVLLRTGPTANYNEQIDSAANIVALIPNCQIGSCFTFRHYNNTAFTATMVPGAGVSFGGFYTTTGVNSYRDWIFQVTNVATPAVTMWAVGAGTR